MKKVYLFLADGFETVEALASVDIMRRAGIQVVTVSVMGRKEVLSAHDIVVLADALLANCDFSDADALILPGGGQGTENLSSCEPLRASIALAHDKGCLIAAICAAPMVLGRMGLLHGRKATCYPGCEAELTGADYTASNVEKDRNIITACGPAASFDFAFAIVEYLCGKETAAALRAQMQFA